MLHSSSLIYEYDGTSEGFLTCVYEAFTAKICPQMIVTPETATLFHGHYIETDSLKAEKIEKRLKQRLTKQNFQFISRGFLTNVPDKEVCLLIAIDIALEEKGPLIHHIGNPPIKALYDGIRAMGHEAHLYKGFIRFTIVEDALYSTIEPKHFVLPSLVYHFLKRYPRETIYIYDKTHKLLLVLEKGKYEYYQVEEAPNLPVSEEEKAIQNQWRTFFNTIAIKERKNYRCQITHMPKRFWGEMTEFQET